MQIELVIRYNEAFKGNRIDLMATIHTRLENNVSKNTT